MRVSGRVLVYKAPCLNACFWACVGLQGPMPKCLFLGVCWFTRPQEAWSVYISNLKLQVCDRYRDGVSVIMSYLIIYSFMAKGTRPADSIIVRKTL